MLKLSFMHFIWCTLPRSSATSIALMGAMYARYLIYCAYLRLVYWTLYSTLDATPNLDAGT